MQMSKVRTFIWNFQNFNKSLAAHATTEKVNNSRDEMALYRHGMCRTSLSLSLSWCHKVSYSISLKVKTEQREFIMRLIKPDGERLLYHHTEIFHNLETRILSALSLPLNWIPFISGSFFVCCAHCIECSVKFFSTQPLFPTRSWLIFFLRIPQKVLPYLILKRKSFDTIRVGNWGDSRLVYSEFWVHFANFLIFF